MMVAPWNRRTCVAQKVPLCAAGMTMRAEWAGTLPRMNPASPSWTLRLCHFNGNTDVLWTKEPHDASQLNWGHGSADPQLWGRSLVYFIMLSPPSGEAKLSQDPIFSVHWKWRMLWILRMLHQLPQLSSRLTGGVGSYNMKLWLVLERGVGFGHSFKATWSRNSWWSMSSDLSKRLEDAHSGHLEQQIYKTSPKSSTTRNLFRFTHHRDPRDMLPAIRLP